ncbi:MAG: anti-sigma F factor [Clostridia bacterium]|nr:anti-sigma F factor [Clostridia bacterium]
MAVKLSEINRFSVKFPSKSTNESFARSMAAAFIAQLDPTLDELGDVKTAVSEAVTNAIVHGYRDSIGDITMTVRLLEPDTVEITVADKGCGIADVPAAREPLFTTGGAERSGMGFTIMESFMDSLRVRSAPGKGTSITMRKRLNTRRYISGGSR